MKTQTYSPSPAGRNLVNLVDPFRFAVMRKQIYKIYKISWELRKSSEEQASLLFRDEAA